MPDAIPFNKTVKTRAEAESSADERLVFECLLFELSSQFANLAGDQFEIATQTALLRIREFLGFDRGTFAEFLEDGAIDILSSNAIDGVDPVPLGRLPLELSWYHRRLLAGEMVILQSLPDDLPPEAVAEAALIQSIGLRAQVSIPLRTGTLKVDGKEVATKRMPKTLPMILQWDESFDVGSDTLTGVNDADYKPPFALTAKLNKLTIKVDRPQLSPADIKKLEASMRAASDGPTGQDLDLVQKIEARVDKREDCRKQADAKKLGPFDRIGFVRECMK
jgi:hypothetical protein